MLKTSHVLALIIAGGVAVSALPFMIYGEHTAFGGDALYFYGRGTAYEEHGILLNQSYYNASEAEMYPPGGTIFLMAARSLTGLPFILVGNALTILLPLMVGLMAYALFRSRDRALALAAAFFSVFFVYIAEGIYSGYVYLDGLSIFGPSGSLTNLWLLITFYCLAKLYTTERADHRYTLLLFVVYTAHGITHAGGLLMHTAFFAAIFASNLVFFRDRFRRDAPLVTAVAASACIQLLVYWGPATREAEDGSFLETLGGYVFRGMAEDPVLVLVVAAIAAIACIPVVALARRQIAPLVGDHLTGLYLGPYLLGYVLIFLAQGVYEGRRLNSPFMLIYGLDMSTTSVIAQAYAVAIFALTAMGIGYITRNGDEKARTVLYFYLIAYALMVVSYVSPIPLHPNRMVTGVFLLAPFAMAGGVIGARQILGRIGAPRKAMTIALVLVMLSPVTITALRAITKDPVIMDHEADGLPSIGIHQDVRFLYPTIEGIEGMEIGNMTPLATPETYYVLAASTTLHPVILERGHGGKNSPDVRRAVINSLSLMDEDAFFEAFGAETLVLSAQDKAARRSETFRIDIPVDAYDDRPGLSRVLVGGAGEEVYRWAGLESRRS